MTFYTTLTYWKSFELQSQIITSHYNIWNHWRHTCHLYKYVQWWAKCKRRVRVWVIRLVVVFGLTPQYIIIS